MILNLKKKKRKNSNDATWIFRLLIKYATWGFFTQTDLFKPIFTFISLLIFQHSISLFITNIFPLYSRSILECINGNSSTNLISRLYLKYSHDLKMYPSTRIPRSAVGERSCSSNRDTGRYNLEKIDVGCGNSWIETIVVINR